MVDELLDRQAEILDAWFAESVKEEEKPTIAHLEEIEARHRLGDSLV